VLELTTDKPLNPHLSPTPKLGPIVLLGSGPGHPAHPPHRPNTHYPRRPRVGGQSCHAGCARSHTYPARQNSSSRRSCPEMMQLAAEGTRKGLYVVRVCSSSLSMSCHELTPTMKLKQGDPSVYDHSSEEVPFFRARGLELLVSGISSAMARPTFGG
jgi:hypothetical protein